MSDKDIGKVIDIKGNELPDSIADDSIEAMGLGIQRRGTMHSGAYEMELKERIPNMPESLDVDNAIIKIAKGTGIKTFENPQQLAVSLVGFEDWCKDKNVIPSFAAVCSFLCISKGTLLKYQKDTTQYTIMVIEDSITGEYIYSTTNKSKLDKYISSYNIVDGNGNTVSIKESIENGNMNIAYKSVSFADVLEPIFSMIELVTTNRAWDMRNPAWPIYLSKNSFGATTQFTDKQEMAISLGNSIDDLDDVQILKAAQSRPEG